MKKIIILTLMLLLSVNLAFASPIASIGMQGLSFINPEIAGVVQKAMCFTSPLGAISCAQGFVQGKVVGEVTGQVYQKIAEDHGRESVGIYKSLYVSSLDDKSIAAL